MILFLAIVLAPPAPLGAAPAKGVGMWVWSESSFSTNESRLQLVEFCVKHHISHLDIHVRMKRDDVIPRLTAAEAFRDLILLAGKHNITTAALRGDPKMFFSQNHEQALRELRAIIDFSETLPKDNLFRGIKYDVEPYRTEEWKTSEAGRKSAILDYLTFLRKARSVVHAKAPHLWLAADIPFWWDKDKFILEFEGIRKRFNEHIQDLTDFIVVMSYRRNAQQVLQCVDNEWQYAKQIDKVIFVSLETIKLTQDQHISFWGLPVSDFWHIIPQLLDTAKDNPAIGGIMIHCYRSFAEKFHHSNSFRSEANDTVSEWDLEPYRGLRFTGQSL
jgi:hypothetical protein